MMPPSLRESSGAEAPPPYVARPIYEICKIPTITPSPDPKPLSSGDTWLLIYRVLRASLSLFRFIAVCLHIPIPSHPIQSPCSHIFESILSKPLLSVNLSFARQGGVQGEINP
jgi:hypothetical protein